MDSELLPWIAVIVALGVVGTLGALVWIAIRLAGLARVGVESADLRGRLDSVLAGNERLERELRAELAQSRQEAMLQAQVARQEAASGLAGFAQTLHAQVSGIATLQSAQLEAFGQQLGVLTEKNEQRMEAVKGAVEQRLDAIRIENASKLEQMRATVDEKLQSTLEQRLGQSFRLVSERLEQVQRGLGEMQSLAAGVGDLKRVLTNVKTRGVWGEVQLESLLEQVLIRAQYEKNVATRPGSAERVEFAIRLPGRDDATGTAGAGAGEGTPVWLPIDAKFPIEDWSRLQEAAELADAAAVEEASRQLESRIRGEAAKIHDKYISPPHTTDFAILYLPVEGLYAEVLRRTGLTEQLQRDCHVMVAGPTTLAALLNSLQMGFRTLAIEKRSAEVWALLAAVKTEFGKFADVLARTKDKLERASDEIGNAERRTRAIERKLKGVEALPEHQAAGLLADERPLAPVVALVADDVGGDPASPDVDAERN